MADYPVADFHTPDNDLRNWFPRLQGLDVPTPKTHEIELEPSDNGASEWDTEAIKGVVESLGGTAFVRSGYKSAQLAGDGSHIRENTTEEIDNTLAELLSQHVMMQMPTGGSLWLREMLDVNFCAYAREPLVPEVRVFIRDGEVVCHHPRLEGFEHHESHRETAESYIKQGWDKCVSGYAECVAEEFTEKWWSVDFVLDRDGNWWCTDMARDAIYERDGERQGMSQHPDDCENDIERLL